MTAKKTKTNNKIRLFKKDRKDRWITVDTKHNKILHSKGFVKNIGYNDTIRCDIVESDYEIPKPYILDY